MKNYCEECGCSSPQGRLCEPCFNEIDFDSRQEVSPVTTKKELIKKLSNGTSYIVVTRGHRYFGLPRKAEKVQKNGIRFEGGSWLMFRDIMPKNITETGFKIASFEYIEAPLGGFPIGKVSMHEDNEVKPWT